MPMLRRTVVPALLLAALLAGCSQAPAPESGSGAATAQPAAAPNPAAPLAQGPIEASAVLDEAPYRIDIPANWNGSLVMLLHGYEPQGMPREDGKWPQDPFAGVFLARGYAVAASGYSQQGWAVAQALPETEQLRQHFVATYGQPKHTYAYGYSLGGHLALATVERHPEAYSGALTTCGINLPAGDLIEDGILTPLLAFDYFYPKALGLPDGGLADPAAPPMVDPAAIETALAGDEAKAAILVERLQIPRPALAGALMLNYMVLRELQQRAGGHPVDNRETKYAGFGDDAAFNQGVRRYEGVPAAIEYMRNHAALSGRIADPVVVLNNVVDQTVPPRFTTQYPALVAAAGASERLVVLPPVGEGHCAFEPQQIDGAFGTLVDWAEQGKRPAAN